MTGGTGFLAVHTILQLVRHGYSVKTTIRSFSKKESIMRALNEGGLTNPGDDARLASAVRRIALPASIDSLLIGKFARHQKLKH